MHSALLTRATSHGKTTKGSMPEPWQPAHVSDYLGHQHLAIDSVDPTCFGWNYEVPRILDGPTKSSYLNPSAHNCHSIGQRVWAHVYRLFQEAVKEKISLRTRQRSSMARLHVFPERLLHKRLLGGAQPFQLHQRALARASGPTMCVSCKAPESMCKVLFQENLPELQKMVLAFMTVHVVCVCVAACGELGTTRPLLQRDVMQAPRCGLKSKATLGPAVKNVFVPRWLKQKTVAQKTRSSAVAFPAALSFLPREARFQCFCLPLSALWHGLRFSSVVQPKAWLAGLPCGLCPSALLQSLLRC